MLVNQRPTPILKRTLLRQLGFLLATTLAASAQYSDWAHSGSLYLLTTPEGANLPAGVSLEEFPVLVRLDRATFNFSQSQNHGEDLRFSDPTGKPLPYQIEAWDSVKGSASIWVRVPKILGNQKQEIRLHWGRKDAASESKGRAVFNESNGYAGVWHLGETLTDEVGSLVAEDGTSPAPGAIGGGRQFARGQGIGFGQALTNLPANGEPFTTELWFKADKPGGTIIGWGNEKQQGKAVMQLASPPHLQMDCYFSAGNVSGTSDLPLSQWIHAVHTYEHNATKVYVNGRLDGSRVSEAAPLLIKTPMGLWLGGWHGNYDFNGVIDEVRISRLVRPDEWIRLEYENQKPLQTLVGTLVTPGDEFSLSTSVAHLDEGQSITVNAKAGGAQKVYWLVKREGQETLVATDQFSYTLQAGRVKGNQSFSLLFKAVCAGETKTKEVALTILDTIPEPEFSLRAPKSWNGRDRIEIVPEIKNLAALRAKGAGELHYRWTISGGAVIREEQADRLVLTRSQCRGAIRVTLALSNGGEEVTAETAVSIKEPARDAWVERKPDPDEQPEDNQFYARNDRNEGTLYYLGKADAGVERVFLRILADGQPFHAETRRPNADGRYEFAIKLKPGLIHYEARFGTHKAGQDTITRTVTNLVCGDAYLIEGQSNAEAVGPNNGPPDPVSDVNQWLRSFGSDQEGSTKGRWGNAVRTHAWGKPEYGEHQVGAWGMMLGSNLVVKYKIPICLINGAIGGTPIYQHQRNPTNHFDVSGGFYENPYKIYGSHLTRITAAHLTHGIRGVLWHQGENDSGSGAPDGRWDYESYQQYFVEMAAAWKQDYPNLQHYYVFQVWPLPCMMGPKDDYLREVQRTLPHLFSHLRVMSTLGIEGKDTGRGLCHYDLDGYAQMARLISPLIEEDNYGLKPAHESDAPNLRKAWFSSSARDEITLDFGQPVLWKPEAAVSLYLDQSPARISSGSVNGNHLVLKLSAPAEAKTVTYLKGKDWNGKPAHLLRGANGIAALTFCDVGIASTSP